MSPFRPRARAACLVVTALIGIAVLLWLARRDHGAVADVEAPTPSVSAGPAAADAEDVGLGAGEERVAQREPAPLVEAGPAPIRAKPLRSGLSAGSLPSPSFFDSKPRFSDRHDIDQGLEARAHRAATLDRRLESRITHLRSEAERAEPARRPALEQQLSILESQLGVRRAWEAKAAVPTRPSVSRDP